MRLDLSEIAAHVGKRIRYTIDEPPLEDLGGGLICVDRVAGEAIFSNAGSSIVVRGRFRTAVELPCSRCLNSFRVDIDAAIEEELPLAGHLPGVVTDEEEEELPEEEREPLFVDNIFDLTELIRQQILIEVPIKPLCTELCQGLCAHCGANLNEGPCECPPEDTSSPFAALGSLLEKEDEKEPEN